MLIAGMQAHVVYGKTEAEELKEQLEQNEENLGNLNDFKVVVDEMYTDITTATKVDDALKQKLKKDVENLNNVEGINPLIVSVLSIELESYDILSISKALSKIMISLHKINLDIDEEKAKAKKLNKYLVKI